MFLYFDENLPWHPFVFFRCFTIKEWHKFWLLMDCKNMLISPSYYYYYPTSIIIHYHSHMAYFVHIKLLTCFRPKLAQCITVNLTMHVVIAVIYCQSVHLLVRWPLVHVIQIAPGQTMTVVMLMMSCVMCVLVCLQQ